jgi:hypothetical protein
LNHADCRENHTASKRRGVVMSNDEKVNWDEIEFKIVPEGNPNSKNPYSNMTPEERINHLDLIIRKINTRIANKKKKETKIS